MDYISSDSRTISLGTGRTGSSNSFAPAIQMLTPFLNTKVTSFALRSIRESAAEDRIVLHSFGDRELAALCTLLPNYSQITELELSKSNITTSGLEVLGRFLETDAGERITDLDLSENDIDSEGVEVLYRCLGGNRQLESLNLEWNRFDQDGVEALRSLIEQNKGIRKLNLCANFIGKNITHLHEALRKNRYLRVLELENNNFTGSEFERFFSAFYYASEEEGSSSESDVMRNKYNSCSKIEELNLSFNPITDGHDAFRKLLSRNKFLKVLTLNFVNNEGNKYLLSGKIAQGLKENDTLEKLVMEGNNLAYQDMINIADMLNTNRNTSLKHINFNHNHIDEAGVGQLIRAVTSNTSLISISLNGNFYLEEEVENDPMYEELAASGNVNTSLVRFNPRVKQLQDLLPRQRITEPSESEAAPVEKKKPSGKKRKFAKKKKKAAENLEVIKMKRKYSPATAERFMDNEENDFESVVFDRRTNSTSGQKFLREPGKDMKKINLLINSKTGSEESSKDVPGKRKVRNFRKKHNKNKDLVGPNPMANEYSFKERQKISKKFNDNLENDFESVVFKEEKVAPSKPRFMAPIKRKGKGKKGKGRPKAKKDVPVDDFSDIDSLINEASPRESVEYNSNEVLDLDSVLFSTSYITRERNFTMSPPKRRSTGERSSGQVVQEEYDSAFEAEMMEDDEEIRLSMVREQRLDRKKTRILAARSLRRSNDKFIARLEAKFEDQKMRQLVRSNKSSEQHFGIINISEQEIKNLNVMLSDFGNMLDREENNFISPKSFADSTFTSHKAMSGKSGLTLKTRLRNFASKKGLIGHIRGNVKTVNGFAKLDLTVAKEKLIETLVDRRIMKNVSLIGIYDMLKGQIGSGVSSQVSEILPSTFVELMSGRKSHLSLDYVEDFQESVLFTKYLFWNILKISALSLNDFPKEDGTPSVGEYVDTKGRQLLHEFAKTVIERKEDGKLNDKQIFKYNEQIGKTIIDHSLRELIDVLVFSRPLQIMLECYKAIVSYDDPNPDLHDIERRIKRSEKKAENYLNQKRKKMEIKKDVEMKVQVLKNVHERAKKRSSATKGNSLQGSTSPSKSGDKHKQKLDKLLKEIDEMKEADKKAMRSTRGSKKKKDKQSKAIQVTGDMLFYRDNNLERLQSLEHELRSQTETLNVILSIKDLLPFMVAFSEFEDLKTHMKMRIGEAKALFPKWLKSLIEQIKGQPSHDILNELEKTLVAELNNYYENSFAILSGLKKRKQGKPEMQDNYMNSLLNSLFSKSRSNKMSKNLLKHLKDTKNTLFRGDFHDETAFIELLHGFCKTGAEPSPAAELLNVLMRARDTAQMYGSELRG